MVASTSETSANLNHTAHRDMAEDSHFHAMFLSTFNILFTDILLNYFSSFMKLHTS